MVGDLLIVKFHVRVAQCAVLGDAPFHPHAPHFERAGFEFLTHQPDHLGFGQTQAFLDRLESGAVFPRHLNDG